MRIVVHTSKPSGFSSQVMSACIGYKYKNGDCDSCRVGYVNILNQCLWDSNTKPKKNLSAKLLVMAEEILLHMNFSCNDMKNKVKNAWQRERV